MTTEKLQQVLFLAYDIKNNTPKQYKSYIVNPDSDETVLDCLNEIIDILEDMGV